VVERESLEAAGVPLESISSGSRSPEGGRRPMRTIVRNIEVDSGLDDHGPYIRVAFDLPRGSYATVVMREIMKVDESKIDDATPE
jgi:tRNA pseudouridine13 synthase